METEADLAAVRVLLHGNEGGYQVARDEEEEGPSLYLGVVLTFSFFRHTNPTWGLIIPLQTVISELRGLLLE